MQKMFREANDGLKRRFNIEAPVVFDDYNDVELEEILAQKV